MIVPIGNSCGLPLFAIEGSGGEGAVQIIQDLSFESAHEQLVSSDIGEGNVGDVHFLGSVGEEQRVVAVGTGLDAVGVARVVVEPDVVDADVT